MHPTREQLDLAAKAAGINLFRDAHTAAGVSVCHPDGSQGYWRPTESKSDSFDLMIVAHVSYRIRGDDVMAWYSLPEGDGTEPYVIVDIKYYPTMGDAIMAAIFLCAVEIGRLISTTGTRSEPHVPF